MTPQSHIRIGIGGWTFAPWRGTFYPKGLTHAKELAYASERLTSIEVNGTFYRSQTPATFRKWASEVPKRFVFSIKGSRFVTNRRVLKEAGKSIERFLDSGVTELGDKLGPLLWQFAPFKKFDEADFGGFLELLPGTFNGRKLRHVIEVRHDSFKTPEFIELLRKFKIAVGSPIMPPTQHRRHHRRLRLCAAADRARTKSRPLIRRRRSMPGPNGSMPGQRERAHRPAARRCQTQAEGRAARRVCLCDPRGQGTGAGGRDGADRAIEGLSRGYCETPKAEVQSGEIQIRIEAVHDRL